MTCRFLKDVEKKILASGKVIAIPQSWCLSCYHRLNGSSSPVLTATSLSYGKAKNSTSPPQNQNPWPDWDKIWHGWLRRRGDPARKILCKSLRGGLSGKWV